MRNGARVWIMPAEDIPTMLQMIEERIASSESEVSHQHALIRLRHILEEDLERTRTNPASEGTGYNHQKVT